MRLYSIITKIFIVLCLLVSRNALAASGYISGTIKAVEHHGGYCDPDFYEPYCVGAKYLKSEYNTAQPIKEAKVSIVGVINQGSGETVYSLGEGVTNSSGHFLINWYVSSALAPIFINNQVSFQLRWNPTHGSNRFSVVSSSGSQFFLWAGISSLTSNTTSSSPQSLGTLTWGSANSPNAIANLYLGAERMWTHLSVSNRMNAYFENIKVMYPDGCPKYNSSDLISCFAGSIKTVKITDETAIYTLAIILHEMGHAVAHVASRNQEFKSCGSRRYPDHANTHSLDVPLWGCSQFSEGFADFIYVTAIYEKYAPTPVYCKDAGICFPFQEYEKLEISSNTNGTSCGTDENRWEIHAARYLWDLYDNVSDYPGETFNHPLWYFIDTIHAFDNGINNRQKNEPWNSNLSTITKPDGRSTYDYKYLYEYWNNVDTSTIYMANCSPVGT